MHPRVQFLLIKISLWASIYIEPFAGQLVLRVILQRL